MTKKQNSMPTTHSIYANEWQIIYSCHSTTFQKCLCGHNVKRLTYIYNKNTCEIMRIGTTCVKKYGITQHISNSLLYIVLQKYIVEDIEKTRMSVDESYVFTDIETCLRTCIQEKYQEIHLKMYTNRGSPTIDYYDVVVPFRRLLTETCDLVMEYKFLSLKEILQEIENDIHLLDNHAKHRMIDEYEISSASVSSDSSILDTISEIDDEPTEEPIDEPTEEPTEEPIDEPTYEPIDEPTEEPIEEPIDEPIEEPTYEPIDEPMEEEQEEIIKNILENILEKISHKKVSMLQQPIVITPFSQTLYEATADIYTPESDEIYCKNCSERIVCRCAIEYRLNLLQHNIQQFKKDIHAFSENVKNTKHLYKTIYETYQTISNSSSESSS